MANRKRDAGREALEKKGWWRSHRWLVLRRLCGSSRAGDVFERSMVWCVDLARQLQQYLIQHVR